MQPTCVTAAAIAVLSGAANDKCRALLSIYRSLLSMYRALIGMYGALWGMTAQSLA